MDVIFITRCYKPTNILTVKENIKRVFSKNPQHNYTHYLLVDLSYNQPKQSFTVFEDEHTKVFFTQNKVDYYNSYGIDQVLKTIECQQNTWVYILDDDNLITDRFLDIFDNYKDEDVLVVDNKLFCFNYLPIVGHVISRIDISNYVVRLNIIKQNNFYVEGKNSYESDGRFFQNLLKKQYKFKCTHVWTTDVGALKRPLNVLRKDL